MYKVFINNKPIYFLDEALNSPIYSKENIQSFENEADIKQILDLHEKTPLDLPLFVSCKTPDRIIDLFFYNHKKIMAAGGLVLNQAHEILFIERLGLWDLPKGKVEKNEAIPIAAVREVEEECGITSPIIIQELCKTYHTYFAKEKFYFKTTYWYLMTYEGGEKLVPQTEEGISDVRWISSNNMEEQTLRTYPSILDVLESYLS